MDLVTFTEETLNGKLHFWCSETKRRPKPSQNDPKQAKRRPKTSQNNPKPVKATQNDPTRTKTSKTSQNKPKRANSRPKTNQNDEKTSQKET